MEADAAEDDKSSHDASEFEADAAEDEAEEIQDQDVAAEVIEVAEEVLVVHVEAVSELSSSSSILFRFILADPVVVP